MMNNYLLLKFKSARLFRKTERFFRKSGKNNKNQQTIDYSFNLDGSYSKRDLLPSFVEPITVHQISNMLHVLFNERPVSTLRGSLYNKNEYLFEKAKNSFLKIDTPKYKKFDNEDYPSEIIQTKKAVWNSWNKSINLDWEIVRRYIDDKEKFNTFVDNLKICLNFNPVSIPFIKVIDLVSELEKEIRISLYSSIKELKNCGGLIYCFGRYDKGNFADPVLSGITKRTNNCSAKTNNRAIEYVYVLSGEIVVPVSDDDLDKLKKYSKGYANILDGGFVWFEKIIPNKNFNNDEYKLVGDISLEMNLPAETVKI